MGGGRVFAKEFITMETDHTVTSQPQHNIRFTPEGDASAEQRIASDQQLIANAVQAAIEDKHFCALVLIGGYARGEGGIVFQRGQPAPYNDYDYFVVVKDMKHRALSSLGTKLASLAKELEQKVGVEVDFAILTREALPASPPSLMFAEMLWGHRVVAGDPQVLNSIPVMPFSGLPMGEFTRLMLNRGALLLLNQQTISRGELCQPEDRDRFIKYLFKATLACGDAQLAVAGLYHPLYRIKWLRLQQLPQQSEAFLRQYELALSAKFHPQPEQFADTDLTLWQQRTIALWCDNLALLESQRLGQPVTAWHQYASPKLEKGQSQNTLYSLLRNLAVTLRDYGPLELLTNPRWSLRYPRERLISILPQLLLEMPSANDIQLQQALGRRPANTGINATSQFLEQWQRYA
jgi:hypothetical protein